jgi:putative oxidoreductase
MKSFYLGISRDLGLLVLRVCVSLLMIFPHGLGKLLNFSSSAKNFPDPLGIGSFMSLSGAVFSEVVFSEVVCSVMIILGIKTRWFSVPALFTMLVAAFVIHGNDPWMKKEKAILFGVVFLVLTITGGGKYSVRD